MHTDESYIKEMRYELEAMLIAAKGELSPVRAKATLRDVREKCLEQLKDEIPDEYFALLASSAMSELAKLETNPEARKRHRRKAISVLHQHLSKESRVELYVALSNSVTDHFYDHYAQEETPKIRSELADVKRIIKEKLNKEDNSQYKIMLLSQMSSILRCQSMIVKQEQKHAYLQEAVRASERATKEVKGHPFAHLEYAQALWNSARLAKSDEQYYEVMRDAEKSLTIAVHSEAELPLLVLARFYRQTYRPALAVKAFLEYENRETIFRRLLSETFVIGEAAMQLWYNEYSEKIVFAALNEARRLLELSIDAGYENARIFVDLAMIEAALGESHRVHSLLARLAKGGADDWLNVIHEAKDAITKANFDVISRGFALGIADHAVWNSLGTYAHEFLKDDALAVQLYGVGFRLSPRNPVILTNMARSLIVIGDDSSLHNAKSHLRNAARYSDRSFTWWRGVQATLYKKLNSGAPLKPRGYKNQQRGITSYKEIRKAFFALDNNETDKHVRGRRFQSLFEDLLRITYGTGVVGSHRVHGREVDAAFKWDGKHYRVETKWESKPSGSPDFDTFRTKLGTADARGVFVSIAGFSRGAIDAAKDIGKKHVIVLIDGDEMRAVFEGELRLETVLESKLQHFDMYGDPYYKVQQLRKRT